MRAHRILLLSLCLLAVAYAVLLFVAPAAAPIGIALTAAGLVLVSTRYAWRAVPRVIQRSVIDASR